MQPKYLNTLYLYFPLNILIYLNIGNRLFFISSIKLPVEEITIPHKLGFSEISPPQSVLPSNLPILNLMLINLFIIVFIMLVFHIQYVVFRDFGEQESCRLEQLLV